jgi:two-component system nitrate/nitrite response regulator NarL
LILTEDVFEPESDISAFAESEAVLILLCERLSLNEYLKTRERLKAQCPSAWMVVVADPSDTDAIVRLYEAGLNGLCSPAMVGSSLVKALELVADGETFVPAVVGLALLEQQSRRSGPDAQEGPTFPAAGLAGRLSDREAQILRGLMQGASNKMIARQLGLAEATVKVPQDVSGWFRQGLIDRAFGQANGSPRYDEFVRKSGLKLWSPSSVG